jgi:hypothetical protein
MCRMVKEVERGTLFWYTTVLDDLKKCFRANYTWDCDEGVTFGISTALPHYKKHHFGSDNDTELD